MKMNSSCFHYILILVCVQVHLPVDMFPANSGDERKLSNSTAGREKGLNTRGNIKVNQHYYELVDNSNPNKTEYVPIIAASTVDLNMKGHHNVKHVAEFIMESEHSKPSEKPPGLLGSVSKQHNNLNGVVNQARPIDLHEFKKQADENGLEADLGTNQIKSFVSLPPRDLIDTKLEQVQQRLSNLSDNIWEARKTFPMDHGRSREPIKQKILQNSRLDDTDINILTDSQVESKELSINSSIMDRSEVSLIPDLDNAYVEGISWSQYLEKLCSKGYNTEDYSAWRVKVENDDVIKMEEGCGSMQNRLITFNDSTKACVRYRINSDQMQGDIYSFYLSRLLDMNYTPPTKMLLVRKSKQWQNVWDKIIQAKWSEDKPIIITKWVEALDPVFMPEELKDHKRGIRPENYRLDTQRPVSDLCNLMQWSDLVLFDYISGNLDRVVNNMFNLKWNEKMLEKPVHNLEREKTYGRLVFLDNESGLFHGYRLLDTYAQYHKTLLKSVCVFRKPSVEAIENLYKQGNVGETLQHFYEESEPVHNFLPRMGKKNMSILKQRVQNVYNHIQSCKQNAADVHL